MQLPSGTPAGWHPDPLDRTRVRWWNGASWSDNVRLSTSTVSPAMSANSAAYTVSSASVAAAGRIRLIPSQTDAPRSAAIIAPLPRRRELRRRALERERPLPTMRKTYSPHTFWAWLLVASPIWLTALLGVPRWAYERFGPAVIPVHAVALLVGLAVVTCGVAAYFDQRRLRRAGFPRPAHWFWILLSPLGYLVARTVRVHVATGRGRLLLRVHASVGALTIATLILVFVSDVLP